MFLSDTQGTVFNKTKPIYKKIVGNNRLKLASDTTSMPNIDSLSLSSFNFNNIGNQLKEGFSYSQLKNKLNEKNINNINELEKQFNETLTDYKNTYNMYLQSVNQSNTNINQFLGTNVKDSNNNIYYINKFGYLRQYTNNSWQNKDNSCPSNILDLTPQDRENLIANLKVGAPMISGLPCNLEGKVIQTTSSTSAITEKAYIDKQGIKHIFSNDDIYQSIVKQGNCPNNISASIDNTIFNQIQSGNVLSSDTQTCFIDNINTKLWNRVVFLNDKLIEISNEIYNNVNELENEDNDMTNKLSEEKQSLLNTIKELHNERKKMKNHNNRFSSLNSEFNSIQLLNNSLYYQYLMWGFISVSLGYLIYRHVK